MQEAGTLHYVGNVPIKEGTQIPDAIFGNKFVQPNVVDFDGARILVFVFPVCLHSFSAHSVANVADILVDAGFSRQDRRDFYPSLQGV